MEVGLGVEVEVEFQNSKFSFQIQIHTDFWQFWNLEFGNLTPPSNLEFANS